VNLPTGAGEANGTSGSPSISADGRFIAFVSDATNLVPSDTNGAADVFVRDRRTGRTERASVRSGGVQANGRSYQPSISADGGRVAVGSYATNLVPGDTNRRSDVFVRTR
jgi:Tol biopolymer transport system component